MSHDDPNKKLVYMANQIGSFFRTRPHDEAVAGIEDHIRKFWEPRMRAKIVAHLDAGGDGLAEQVREAVGRLRAE
jgi:formate dehydrogenase subunit delta